MNPIPLANAFLAAFFCVSLLVNPARGEASGELPARSTDNSREEKSFHQAIMDIEAREGAYSSGLSESLLGLGQMLQAQGRHEEAIRAFKRGAHLARINEGLHSQQQIPLLQGEIDSHKARGDYLQVDERQNYLYRVEVHSLRNSDRLATALMQQAQWQYEAYMLGLEGSQRYSRLMNMSDLYRMAISDVIDREGDISPNLLAPLKGMLQTQYLISSYEVRDSDQIFGEDGRPNESLLRFNSYRAKSFEQGTAILGAISDIEEELAPANPLVRAHSKIMLGDWQLWNGKTEGAWEAYKAANTELAGSDDAKAVNSNLFSEPVALPDLPAVNLLPPAVSPDKGDILLSFDVSDRGKVRDLERVDGNDIDSRRASNLMRQLRKTRFRPRFEGGQPVETGQIVRAYAIQ